MSETIEPPTSQAEAPTPGAANPSEKVDVLVIGAGAAGLFASIFAARNAPAGARVLAVDGAKKLGAKILVAGGGRCNVTHHRVDESAYAGSSRHAVRKVLGRFTVEDTVAFFAERGVELKREETGKLFPTTDDAQTVLDALLSAVRDAGATIRHPWRAGSISRDGAEFVVQRAFAGDASHTSGPSEIRAARVILATGGMALPRSGSDGAGYALARALGHTTTSRIFPALVPLLLPEKHFLRELSGIALRARVTLVSGTGKRLESFENDLLFTHFGLSGPAALDISRYLLDAIAATPSGAPMPRLHVALVPELKEETLDQRLQTLGRGSVLRLLCDGLRLPERLARALLAEAGLRDVGQATGATLTRDQRRAIARLVTDLPVEITGDRGFTFAEVTAGGVPLGEVRLETMESRACPGLHLCGEILDVDGRIGGFNFQWAWASGFTAGQACGTALAAGTLPPA
ncbi:MAG: NAD(P)/FAD-dependent oxidoreductase [Planctomycetota bacterium]|nr:NAD(P)/FAD-dependent oxidoreductase [Planctomycetota bacterium]